MTMLDLDAIEARTHAHEQWTETTWDWFWAKVTSADDVPALIAEVRRLREHEAMIRALIARQISDKYSGERGWVWHPDLLYVLDDEALAVTSSSE
jgi:hypothetical protein